MIVSESIESPHLCGKSMVIIISDRYPFSSSAHLRRESLIISSKSCGLKIIHELNATFKAI